MPKAPPGRIKNAGTSEDTGRSATGPNDADGNGSVSVADVGTGASNFGQSSRGPRQGDLNGDGIVSVGDVGILATLFGQALPGGDPALVSAPSATSTMVRDATRRRLVPRTQAHIPID